MLYRKMGKTRLESSLLGFGCMRYHESGEEEAQRAIRRAVELGVNYFETSIGYGRGESELLLGKGLKGLRDKVMVSTKSSPEACPTAAQTREKIEESLKKLQVDYVDWYQCWGVNRPELHEVILKKDGPLEAIRKAQSEGLIRHVGFTTHDRSENVIKLMRTGEFESVTVFYSVAQRQQEPVIAAAKELEMGLVIMRPLAGGLIAKGGTFDVLRWGSADSARETALLFLFSYPEVSTCISGMTTTREVEQNAATVEKTKILNAQRRAEMVAEFDKTFQKTEGRFCTNCHYCLPCPQGVFIPLMLELLSSAQIFGAADYARIEYKKLPDRLKPTLCVECGECIDKCPDRLPIIDMLKEVEAMFGG